MSIIFQLFHADDLDRLSQNELDQIVDVIKGKSHLLVEALQSSLKPDPQGGVRNVGELTDAVRKRREVVAQQLRLREASSQQPKTMRDSELDQLQEKEKARKLRILNYAVDCEEGNRNFYEVLKNIRDDVYDEYRRLTQGQEPKDPDTLYSLFNPRGPLNRLYNP